MQMYRVTKQFVSGMLEGLTVTEMTSVRYTKGREYKACAGSSNYVVTEVVPCNS